MVTALLLTGLAAAGCHRRSELPDPGIPYPSSTTSEKLATFLFKEEGRLYLMTVSVNATRFHDKDPFIPISVALANKTGTPLQIHRESFTLVDPVSGARYGLAGVEEVRRQGKMLYDLRLNDQEHLGMKLDGLHRAEAYFYGVERLATRGFGEDIRQRLVIDNVELHSFQYILDTLYFPRPEGELLGRTFELHVNSKGLQQPLFVVFTVPEK
jgi:hypothetical protein